ncbi:MAG: glycosyltransferase family 2 protein, partial [Gemmatimonadota bacterium]
IMVERPRLSVVSPLYNEQDNVLPLVDAVAHALGEAYDWELILVDDGSRDATYERMRRAAQREPRVRPVRLARNYGQSTATQAGFDHARGRVIVTLDGDLQNDPADIPMLLSHLDRGYDLVTGYRKKRHDRFLTRTLPSGVANTLIRWLTGVRIRDNGCSLKAYRRNLVVRLGLYSDMHRFIPAVAVGMTGARIVEVPVRHRPRRFGKSKYGLSRVWKVLTDLLTIIMIRWFWDRPLHMFAFGAAGSFLIGALFAVGALLDPYAGAPEVGRVAFIGAALLWMGLGLYLLMLGLIAEVALYGVSTDEQRRPRMTTRRTSPVEA